LNKAPPEVFRGGETLSTFFRERTVKQTLSFAAVAGTLFACGLVTSASSASFHTWRMVEVYSNSSGTIQFVEFQQGPSLFDDERFVGGQTLTESGLGHSFTIPSNLPSEPAANSNFLIATPGYAALSGVPAADYVLPINNWLKLTGDTLTFATFVDTLTFTGAQFPSDGSLSLKRAYGAAAFTTSTNSPTNFAGVTGTVNSAVPEPATLMALVAGGVVAARRRRGA
jgi:hypothetical protein